MEGDHILEQPVSCSSGAGYAEFCCIPRTSGGTKTVNSRLYYTHPLKLLVPRHPACYLTNCQWLYQVNSGAGLKGGHCVSLDIVVGENCKVVFTTQEYTKIPASDTGLVTRQELRGRVADKGLLAVLPDPFVCYKNAVYNQKQVYDLTSEGNLIVLDWVIAGRIALGEVWDLTSCVSESKVYIDGRLVFGDAIDLANNRTNAQCTLRQSLHHTNVLGSCVFIGPYFKELKHIIQEKVNEISNSDSSGITASTSVLNQPLCDGIVIKLLSASTTEQARTFFKRVIEDITSWLGGDPLEK